MKSKMKVTAIDENSSEIHISADFVVKGSLLGWIMGLLRMRPVMKSIFKKVMRGLAYHAMTGKLVGEQLPPKEERAKITFI
jgi:hypothetical protein